ncbi:hypothetical protein N9891_01560 [bacterium]|nr:hypothetical protein [bacterium]
MSQRTYICEDCRTTKRAEAAGGHKTAFRCPGCRQTLWELSQKFRIPPKNDDKAWKALAISVKGARETWDARLRHRGTELLKKVDHQIAEVSRKEESRTRTGILKDLQKSRAEILSKYFADELEVTE